MFVTPSRLCCCCCFFHDPSPTVIYTYCPTLSLHDSLPISIFYNDLVPLNSNEHGEWRIRQVESAPHLARQHAVPLTIDEFVRHRSEEHTSELQSLMRISYAVFCLKKKNYRSLDIMNMHMITHTDIEVSKNKLARKRK